MRSSTRTPKRFFTVAASTVLLSATALAGCSSADSQSQNTTQNAQHSTTAASASTSTTADTISDTSDAAQEFLATLSDEQRDTVLYDFNDETKTTSWSNFPVTFVERSGINLKDLNEEQKAAALKVLASLLNEDAYAEVSAIMDSDHYLHDESSTNEESLGQYYIAFFGTPSDSTDWAVQFGGHHLGINATFSDGEITFAPTHLGVQPSEWTNAAGEKVSALSGMYDTAFAFYDSLSEEQKAQLYQGEDMAAMVCAPGSTCDYPTGTGLKASELSDEQKDLLIDVINNWVGLADDQTTATQIDAIRATLGDTYINWSGATSYDTSSGDGIYFQISGPKVYIEFANQSGSADADIDGVITSGWGHIHTIYRDPSNDYANSVTQEASSGPGGSMMDPPSGGVPAAPQP